MKSKEEEELKVISNEVKDAINSMTIVTPTIYASLFAKKAQEHGIGLEDEEAVSQEIIQQECLNLTDLQQKTSTNTQKLSQTTTKAIDAIKSKDESLLQEVLRETQELKHEIELLRESLYKDELTHAYNRKWLHDNFINEEKKFLINGTIAIIDLNYFKTINDTHGHIIGDKVLIFMANQLKSIHKNVVRYGGDEFMVIFPEDVTEERAIEQLNRTRENVLVKKLKAHDEMFTLSFSFGVSSFNQNDDLADIIEEADKNMYEDKLQIKKRVKGI